MTDYEYRYKKYKANNQCTRCGKVDAYTIAGRTTCYECTEKRKAELKKYNDGRREEIKIKNKLIYEQNKEKGICAKCGKRPAKKGHVLCIYCLHKAKMRKKPPVEVTGTCAHCKKKDAVKGYKLCEDCLEQIRKAGVKGRESAYQKYLNGELERYDHRYHRKD